VDRPPAPRRRDPPLRPTVLLVALYAIAICFERIVDIEVYKPYRLIGALLVVVALLQRRPRVDSLARLGLLYVAVAVAAGLVHINVRDVPSEELVRTVLLWSFNLATYVAIVSLLRSAREVVIVLVVHAAAMVFASYDILTHAAEVAAAGALTRQSGDFKNPAHACLSMLVAVVVLVSLLRHRLADRRRGLLARPVILVLGAAIAVFEFYVSTLTGSRAGAALFAGAAVVYVAVLARRRAAVVMAAAAGCIALVVSQPGLWPEPLQANILVVRVASKGFNLDRIYIWRAGLDAFFDTYGLGVGLGQYRTVHQEYFAPYALSSDQRWQDSGLTLHSDFVAALVEGGLVGLVVFVVLCRRMWGMSSGVRSVEARAVALAVIVAAAINALSHSVLPYFGLWFYLALLSSWVRLEPSPMAVPAVAKARLR
jgi:O-antigen ligase